MFILRNQVIILDKTKKKKNGEEVSGKACEAKVRQDKMFKETMEILQPSQYANHTYERMYFQ